MHGFGQSSDMSRFAPKAILTSLEDSWGDYYVGEAKAVMDGTWKSHDTWGGLAAGMVKMGPYVNMPDDVKAMAEATEAAIKSGKLNPFKGPITKQDGTLAVKEGEVLPDKEILGVLDEAGEIVIEGGVDHCVRRRRAPRARGRRRAAAPFSHGAPRWTAASSSREARARPRPGPSFGTAATPRPRAGRRRRPARPSPSPRRPAAPGGAR